MTLLAISDLVANAQKLLQGGEAQDAAKLLHRAIAERPATPHHLGMIGTLLYQAGECQLAIDQLRQAVAHPACEADWHVNLAYCLKYQGLFDEALACLDNGHRCFPAHARLRWHRALLRLLLNLDIPVALEDYESRWFVEDFPDRPRNLPIPQWDGFMSRRLTLLVTSEQGFGDTLHFVRYIPLAAKRVGKLIFEVRSELKSLMDHQQQSGTAILPSNVLVVTRGDNFPLPDVQIALLSLPRALGTFDFAHPPCQSAYLAAPKGLEVSNGNEPVASRTVGLVWRGRLTFAKNAIRSFSLDDCRPLFGIPGIVWVSLQAGPAADELKAHPDLPIQDLSAHLVSFFDTARLIRGLDLVITSDTAVAHLAAALGVPTWIGINPIPDWRWGLKTPACPWYDAVTLFRQKTEGDWASVFAAMTEKLSAPVALKLKPAQELSGYDATISQSPDLPELYLNRGNLLRQLARDEEAMVSFERAIELRPDYVKAWNNLGHLHLHRQSFDVAEKCFLRTLELSPAHPETHFNLGRLLVETGRPKEGIKELQDLLDRGVDQPDLHNLIGCAYQQLGRLDDAEYAFRAAIARVPQHVPAYALNLGLLLLLRGDYLAGWPHYEFRLQTHHWQAPPSYAAHCWQGESLSGRRLTVWAEQGLGDSIQFIRFIPELKALFPNTKIEFYCPAPLKRLLTPYLIGHGIEIRPDNEHSGYDLTFPLLSLPGKLGVSLAQIQGTPYLRAPCETRPQAHEKLGALPRPRIGLVWSGNPHWPLDPRRSLPQEGLSSILEVSGPSWVSLQLGKAREDLAKLPLPIIDAMNGINDFADTAALVEELDLVISVDTAVAHLAGALGRPTWLLNRFDSDWRWGESDVSCAWYDSLRIFRQKQPGDWSGAIQAVVAELQML